MLKEEVVEAVQKRKFHIYSVKTISRGIEILTGFEADAARPDRTFNEDTMNYKVDKQLKAMAERLKQFPEFIVEDR